LGQIVPWGGLARRPVLRTISAEVWTALWAAVITNEQMVYSVLTGLQVKSWIDQSLRIRQNWIAVH